MASGPVVFPPAAGQSPPPAPQAAGAGSPAPAAGAASGWNSLVTIAVTLVVLFAVGYFLWWVSQTLTPVRSDVQETGTSTSTSLTDPSTSASVSPSSSTTAPVPTTSTERLTVPLGQTATITLPENAGTGYQWSSASDYNPSIVSVVSRGVSTSSTPGGTQIRTYEIQPLGPGTTDVRFQYKAPGQTQSTRDQIYQVNVT